MKKKNWLSLVLAGLLALSVSGCGNSDQPSESNGANTSSSGGSSSSASNETVEALDGGELSVITVPASAPFPDGVTIMSNPFYDLIEQETGYKIDWQLFKTGEDVASQMNLLMASGKAPDLIQTTGTNATIADYAKRGGLAELDDAFAKYGGYLQTLFPEDVLDMGRIDGKLYSLFRYSDTGYIGSMAIRTDWLEELNLEAPETLDEYYNVLKAFKEAKPDCIPLVTDGSLYHLCMFAGAFGIPSGNSTSFAIIDGKVEYPLLTEKGKAFIEYMHKLYSEGLMDKEFMIDKEAQQKMIAGNGGMMMLNYVEIVRQMDAFLEKNPNGKLEYIAPPKGENGEQGYLRQPLTSQSWIVPKTSQDKADMCVDFLNKANQSKTLVDALCLGFEGEHYEKNGEELVKLDAAADVVYKGYYSRLIVDGTFDNYNNVMEGFSEHEPFISQYRVENDILLAPMDVPASGGKLPQLDSAMNDCVIEMIVNGYSDEAFEAMKAQFSQLGGDELTAEYQEWYNNK